MEVGINIMVGFPQVTEVGERKLTAQMQRHKQKCGSRRQTRQ